MLLTRVLFICHTDKDGACGIRNMKLNIVSMVVYRSIAVYLGRSANRVFAIIIRFSHVFILHEINLIV